MAQLVERWSTNPKVVGSNPIPVEVFGLRLIDPVCRNFRPPSTADNICGHTLVSAL